MELSPGLYRHIVRPDWLRIFYQKNIFCDRFDFSNKMVLDFGSGVGSNCLLFDHSHYIGIDVCTKRVMYARKMYSDYDFRTICACNLPVLDKSVDYILIFSVLHHIPPIQMLKYLAEFRRVLKNNGRLIILEPCYIEHSHLNNLFMRLVDRGKYIQYWYGYIKSFSSNNYHIEIIDIYKQCRLYNKILFSAAPL